jgi:uncharacterized membrane protein YhiD involved in acid resistance|nr:MAG TPA: helicase [Caudoviricetes sp.]
MSKFLYVTSAIWIIFGAAMLSETTGGALIFIVIGLASIGAVWGSNRELLETKRTAASEIAAAKAETEEAWRTAAILKDQMESGLSDEEYGKHSVRMTTKIPEIYQKETVNAQDLVDKIEEQQNEINRLKEATNPEEAKLAEIGTEIDNLERQKAFLEGDIEKLQEQIANKKKEVELYDDDIQLIEFGLYKPVYEFADSELYKNRLEVIRQKQKDMIKANTAANYPDNYKLNGSLSQGQKMVKDNVKQILRSFNNESEVLINKVKFSSVDSYRQRIIRSYEQLNKLNDRMNIAITPEYLDAKLEELTLAYEYAVKKQEEKERAKEERERLREEAKLQKEIEAQRKALEKEQQQYQRALETVEAQLKESPEDAGLLAKKAELEANLVEVHKGIEDVDYREANKRAGYVYIISNIGSFGEGVYKIGMTRRLEPMDRVNELGDASVPFNFDVHAMIFSDDAPALETALHHAFEDRRINMVNNRREFFRVSLDEIEKVVKENFKERAVEFTRVPEAEQFRESEKMRQNP